MVNDRTPAKRLKYSPESLYAPRPQGQLDANVLPFCLGNTVSRNAADALAGAPAASRFQPVGRGYRLTANAAPFMPSSARQQAAAEVSSPGWHSGFGPSLFSTSTQPPAADARAEAIVKHVFEDENEQVCMPVCSANCTPINWYYYHHTFWHTCRGTWTRDNCCIPHLTKQPSSL